MSRIVSVDKSLLDETLHRLREAGAHGAEGIVLWLGRPSPHRIEVLEAFVPKHEAAEDFFWIAEEGMAELLALLRARRWMVAAQVHSHPTEAFHSAADNRWAVVRHEGALSIVLPFFASGVTVHDFTSATATFALARGRWTAVRRDDLRRVIEVTP